MSKSRKTDAAYKAYKKVKALYPVAAGDGQGLVEAHNAWNAAQRTGRRYGNQRKMRAELKVDERRIQRKRNNRLDLD